MFCPSCKDEWPGHSKCPTCGRKLVDMKTMLAEVNIEELPQFADLARQYELGRREKRGGED